jgi:hypothetical protein
MIGIAQPGLNSALALLMLWFLAKNAHDTFAFDDAAVDATTLY